MSAIWLNHSAEQVELVLRPHRSLSPRGFAAFILITFALAVVPLLAVLGSAALWVLLPFIVATLALLWALLRRSFRDGTLTERLLLAPGRVRLERIEPQGRFRLWEADPYEVQVKIHAKPVESYLTLSGGPRDVEIGAFLSPAERQRLKPELERALARAAGYAAPSG